MCRNVVRDVQDCFCVLCSEWTDVRIVNVCVVSCRAVLNEVQDCVGCF